MSIKGIQFIVKNLTTKKTSNQDGFNSEFDKYLRKEKKDTHSTFPV